ncbi:MAG: hypothetical protein KAZ48_03820 [Candidatus Nanopelagicales bacterium]|nr:hypothetical protein [Candidatus Nanopelagicales bacterium]
MAEAVLHIGTKKTGTTFLQEFLRQNQVALAQAGWTYPEFLRRRNHHDLALPFADDKTSEVHRLLGFDTEEGSQELIAKLDRELTAAVQPDQRWIFSSEFLSSRLLTAGEVASMLAFLRKHFTDIRAVVYFRRQEFMVPSTYSQSIREGGIRDLNWRYVQGRMQDFDHLNLYRIWNEQLGPGNLISRPYLEAYKSAPDAVLADFFETTGIPARDDYEMPGRASANPQLSREGIAVMKSLNARFPVRKRGERPLRPQRAAIARRVAEITAGPSFGLSAELLKAMKAYFSPRNATLVTELGGGSEWTEWMDQQPPQTAEAGEDAVSNARLAEVMAQIPSEGSGVSPLMMANLFSRLSLPEGIVDWEDAEGHANLAAARPLPKAPRTWRQLAKRGMAKARARKGPR